MYNEEQLNYDDLLSSNIIKARKTMKEKYPSA